MNVAMLLSCDTFESFFERVLGLDRDSYLASYRNDFSWYYAKGLIDNGVRPILYVPSAQHEGRHETDDGVSVRFLRLPRWYGSLAHLWRAMRVTRWSLYAQERINVALFFNALNMALRTDNVDLLYVQEYWGGRFDHLTARLKLPVAAADHGGVADGVVKWFKPSALKKAAAIYCQTEDECNQVRQYGADPLLLPNGVDTSFFHPPATGLRQRKSVLTVARLTNKQKRTSDLIEAMSLLPPEWTLDIIGTGPDRGLLEARVHELGVASRVTFHGFKNRADIRTFNQSCGVYAMPSANEGMSMAVLEAMSCGAAVVASQIRAFEAIISDGVTGRLFPVGNVPLLAEAILDAWRQREVFGPEAVVAVERFASAGFYPRLAETMQQAAKRGRGEVA